MGFLFYLVVELELALFVILIFTSFFLSRFFWFLFSGLHYLEQLFSSFREQAYVLCRNAQLLADGRDCPFKSLHLIPCVFDYIVRLADETRKFV